MFIFCIPPSLGAAGSVGLPLGPPQVCLTKAVQKVFPSLPCGRAVTDLFRGFETLGKSPLAPCSQLLGNVLCN